jgi:hypothetical protein
MTRQLLVLSLLFITTCKEGDQQPEDYTSKKILDSFLFEYTKDFSLSQNDKRFVINAAGKVFVKSDPYLNLCLPEKAFLTIGAKEEIFTNIVYYRTQSAGSTSMIVLATIDDLMFRKIFAVYLIFEILPEGTFKIGDQSWITYRGYLNLGNQPVSETFNYLSLEGSVTIKMINKTAELTIKDLLMIYADPIPTSERIISVAGVIDLCTN